MQDNRATAYSQEPNKYSSAKALTNDMVSVGIGGY